MSKMIADSLQAVMLAEQSNTDQKKTDPDSQYIFFHYKLIPPDNGEPGAEIVVSNHCNRQITSLVFVLWTSKNKWDSITGPNAKISYLRYPVQIKWADTLRTKINFSAPSGWRYGDVDKIFLYKIAVGGSDISPALKEK